MFLISPLINAVKKTYQRLFLVPVKGQADLPANQIQPIPFGGPAIYADPNSLRFIQYGYSGNAAVYTIISNASRKFGSIPRYVYQVKNEKAYRTYKGMIRDGHYRGKALMNQQKRALHDDRKTTIRGERKAYDRILVEDAYETLLNRPNPTMAQDAFYELNCVYHMTLGESFIWINRGDISDMTDEQADAMEPLEMYVLPPQYIETIPDPLNVWGVLGYWFQIGGYRLQLRANDVIHWKRPNPNFDAYGRQHLRGFSPLNPGNKILTQNESGIDAQVATQQNSGASGVLSNESLTNPSPVQESQLRSVIDRKINNRDMKGAVAMLPGKWDYHNVGQTAVEMDLMKALDSNFVQLCNLWGVPAMLYQVNSTYQNIEQARKDLLTNLLLPLAQSLQAEIDRVMLPAFGLEDSYTSDVDTSSLSELQEDTNRFIMELAQAWWLTPNQRLDAMNEEKSDDPAMDKVWIPAGLAPIDEVAESSMQNNLIQNGFTDQAGKLGSNGAIAGANNFGNNGKSAASNGAGISNPKF